MKNKDIVKYTIQNLDRGAAEFGFSQEFQSAYGYAQEYGLTAMAAAPNFSEPVKTAVIQRAVIDPGAFSMTPNAQVDRTVLIENGVPIPRSYQPTQYSGNPEISKKTAGQSTFMVTITCVKVGTGSGNTQNPIWLFGGDAYSNTSRGYNAVENAGQSITAVVHNNKNALRFRYENAVDGDDNYTDYFVSLGTSGEYPFILNGLTASRGMAVKAIQMEVSDVDYNNQLTNEIKTFFLNDFGKADSNDLTTPSDLYQQSDKGIFIPHQFPISGRDGISLSLLEQNGLITKLYFWATPCNIRKN